MKVIFLQFNKDQAFKVAMLMTQYADLKTLLSWLTEDFFTSKVTAIVQINAETLDAFTTDEIGKFIINPK